MQRNLIPNASGTGGRRRHARTCLVSGRVSGHGLMVALLVAVWAAAPVAMGQPTILGPSPSDTPPMLAPQADVNAQVRRLQIELTQAETLEERESIEQQLRTLRGTRDYYLQDTTVSAYRTYQSPMPADGLVHYELSQQIGATAGSACGACGCNCGGPCRRGPGCPHPWRTGPGWCDDWCTGPHWEVSIDGLFMRRENLDVGFFEAQFAAAASPVEQFHFETGARAYATGRGILGYDVQLGYVGVDTWRSYLDFALPGAVTREAEYRSGFHSGELNIFPQIGESLRLFTGARYLELGEDLWVRDTPTDVETSAHVENKLVGFQVGVRRELWYLTEWAYVEALLNGGIYNNHVKRFNRTGTIGATSIVEQRVYNDIAFVGESALTVVARLNNCVALRGGYQVLFIDGITTAEDTFFFPATRTDSLVYHGAHVGLEYRR